MAVPSDAQLVQAQADLWKHSLCYMTPMALRCAVQLGVPTAIYSLGGTASLADIMAALSLPQSKAAFLARLLRLLVTAGVLGSTKPGIYHLVPVSYLLVEGISIDGEASQRAIVLAATSRHYLEAALGLADWFKKDVPLPEVPAPFEDVHGAKLFEESMADLDPESDKVFHEALAAHDHMGISLILREGRALFKGLQSLTDCCGGDGTTARAIVKAYPHLKVHVLDLPKVIERAPPSDGSVNYVAGDLFHSIPPAQAVMLKLVLHFWSDEDCIKILAQCKKAIPSRKEGGKVIIIDIVVDPSSPMLETQLIMDVLMMVCTRGRQRDENDWSTIFAKAGFSDYKIFKKLGARGIIEVYP